jgi:hypothetical protein
LISPAAGFVVWLGASLVVIADGRRALAAGIALTAAGLAVLALLTAGVPAAAALAVGGTIAAARRFATGPSGWSILPPGSTPRLVLCVATAIIAFWVAAGVTAGPFGSLRFGVIAGLALATARVLSTTEQTVLLSAVAILALSATSVGAIGSAEPSIWPYIAGALVAALIGWLPLRTVSAV